MRERAEVLVRGRVQGVWYRGATRDEAQRLGLDGWVRNLPDGSVQAVFEGDAAALDTMVAWCRVGPPGARVDRAEVTRGTPTGEFAGFSVRL